MRGQQVKLGPQPLPWEWPDFLRHGAAPVAEGAVIGAAPVGFHERDVIAEPAAMVEERDSSAKEWRGNRGQIGDRNGLDSRDDISLLVTVGDPGHPRQFADRAAAEV